MTTVLPPYILPCIRRWAMSILTAACEAWGEEIEWWEPS